MASITLKLGAGQINRSIENADELLRRFRWKAESEAEREVERETGCFYLDYQPITPKDRVVPDDLAVTLLVNSRAGWRAFLSLIEHGKSIDLTALPQKPLELTSPEERAQVAALITQMVQFPGFGASVATKVLHKKRPDLIPILDNQAIFGAYMSREWPEKPARGDSIKDVTKIRDALDWIAIDLNRPENAAAWEALRAIEPERTRIQLFDSVWWMYFREHRKRKG